MDFFIIGFPKSGTTSIANYLNQCSDVFIPDFEPHFFSSDKIRRRPFFYLQKNEKEYTNLYKYNTNKICGEKSVFYIYEQEALKRLYQFNPAAKIIVVKRTPCTFLPAMYYQFAYSYGFTGDFNEFFKKYYPDIISNLNQPLNMVFPKALCLSKRKFNEIFACEIAKLALYDNYIRYVKSIFEPNKLLIIEMSEFFADIENNFKSLLAFIGAETSNNRIQFKRINEAKQVRSLFMHKLNKRLYMAVHGNKYINWFRHNSCILHTIIDHKYFEILNSRKIENKVDDDVLIELKNLFSEWENKKDVYGRKCKFRTQAINFTS